jgi:SAM-dependent methyltransferase
MNNYTRDAALSFPCGDIDLGFCRQCGFISNARFDFNAVRYSPDCEESQGYSPTFSAFARMVARNLVEKYHVRNKTIIEIGCGKGHFLNYICSLGSSRGIGFDPAYVPGRNDGQNANPDVRFIRDFYSDKYVEYKGDLVCCIMTLEHIANPAELVRTVYRSVADRPEAVVVFQVPDVTRILKGCCFEDIYYEHCSYFSPASLSRLFQRFGFDVLNLQTVYNEQYILLEARTARAGRVDANSSRHHIDAMARLISDFQKRYPQDLRLWDRRLEKYRKGGKKVVLWGGGSKGAAFLNACKNAAFINYVVDINPFRQQTFMAGTGQRIVEPGFLEYYQPDVVIIMNGIYRQEIEGDLNRLGLSPVVMTLRNESASIIKHDP